MKKILLLTFTLLLNFSLAQEKLDVTIKDFNETSGSKLYHLIKTDNGEYFAKINRSSNDDNEYYVLAKIDFENKHRKFVQLHDYDAFSTKNILTLNGGVLGQFDRNLVFYKDEIIKNLKSFSYGVLIEKFLKSNDSNGYFFKTNDTYDRSFYFTNGSELVTYPLPYFDYFVDNELILHAYDRLYFARPSDENSSLYYYDLNTQEIVQVFEDFTRDNDFAEGIAQLGDKIILSKKIDESNVVTGVNQNNSTFPIQFIENLDTLTIETHQNFNIIEKDSALLFSGKKGLFKLESGDSIALHLKNLNVNNTEYLITKDSKHRIDGSLLYFTAFSLDLAPKWTIWSTDGTADGTKLVMDVDYELKEFYVKNNNLYFHDENNFYRYSINDQSVVKLNIDHQGITYSTQIDDTLYYAASDEINGNELRTIDLNSNELNFTFDMNSYPSSDVGQMMTTTSHGVFFIANNSLYNTKDGVNFEKLTEESEYLKTNPYIWETTDFQELHAVINNKLVFITNSNTSYLLSYDLQTKTLTKLDEHINFDNVKHYLRQSLIVVGDKVFYSTYNLKVTDGTLEGTKTITNRYEESGGYFPKYNSSKILNTTDNNVYFLGYDYTTQISLYKVDQNGENLEYLFQISNQYGNIHIPKILGVFKDKIAINIYNSETYSNEFYLSDGNTLGTKLPVNLYQHYVNSFYVLNNKMYFIYNNRFWESDGTDEGTKELFQSNYERLYNLKYCGNSFYFEDENFQQIFRYTNGTTKLIKKITTDEKRNLFSRCYRGAMFFNNDDTSNENQTHFITFSTDKEYKDIPVNNYHIENNDYKIYSYLLRDMTMIDNKILIPFVNHQDFGNEMFIGELNDFPLTVENYGNDNYAKTTNIVAYPNPTTNEINLKVLDNSKIESIRIFDALGREIQFINKTSNNTINLSQLNAGIYFMEIKTSTSIETKKIIKK